MLGCELNTRWHQEGVKACREKLVGNTIAAIGIPWLNSVLSRSTVVEFVLLEIDW